MKSDKPVPVSTEPTVQQSLLSDIANAAGGAISVAIEQNTQCQIKVLENSAISINGLVQCMNDRDNPIELRRRAMDELHYFHDADSQISRQSNGQHLKDIKFITGNVAGIFCCVAVKSLVKSLGPDILQSVAI